MKEDFKYSFSDRSDYLDQIIYSSDSKLEVLKKIGVKNPYGGGWYRLLNDYISKYKIDISNINKKKWIKNINTTIKKHYSHEEIFCVNGKSWIAKRKFKKLVEHKCVICGLDSWQGKKISLHVDHINGISYDHRLENLRLLCPNCHSQTNTYCSMNIKKCPKMCFVCKINSCKSKYSKFCSKDCYKKHRITNNLSRPKTRKVVWPTKLELEELLKINSLEAIGRKYGVSGNAVKKWSKSYGIYKLSGNSRN